MNKKLLKMALIIAGEVLLYLVIFYSIQFTDIPNHVSWVKLSGICALIIFGLNWFFLKEAKRARLIIGLITTIAGFVISFIYSQNVYFYASKACTQVYAQNHECQIKNDDYGCTQFKDDPIGEGGFPKSINVTDQCASKMLPYPWNKKAKIEETYKSVNNTYINKAASYSLNYPLDWGFRDVPINLFDQEDRKTLISYTVFSPVYKAQPDFAKGYLETPHGDPLLVVRKAEGKKLQQIIAEYEKHLTSYDIKPKIKRKEQKRIDNTDAMLIVTDTVFADPKISYFIYFFVKNDKIYRFEYESPTAEPLKIPEEILTSFKFIN